MPPNKDPPPPTGPVQSTPAPPPGPIPPAPPAASIPSPQTIGGPEKTGGEKTGGPNADLSPAASPASPSGAAAGDNSLAAKPQQAVTTDKFMPVPRADLDHYFTAQGGDYGKVDPVAQSLIIKVANLRANSKMLLTMRNDQWALWKAGASLHGVSVAATKDPLLYLSSFLINAREMYLETFADSVEMQISLYVYTPQRSLRGRVDLPPGASVTLATTRDQTSVIGLSSFDIEF